MVALPARSRSGALRNRILIKCHHTRVRSGETTGINAARAAFRPLPAAGAAEAGPVAEPATAAAAAVAVAELAVRPSRAGRQLQAAEEAELAAGLPAAAEPAAYRVLRAR